MIPFRDIKQIEEAYMSKAKSKLTQKESDRSETWIDAPAPLSEQALRPIESKNKKAPLSNQGRSH